MRVIAGKARSIPLKAIDGIDTRPTTDRLKETLFNIIAAKLYDCRFLDLFSGSGGIGIEALSRGAKTAFFIENNKQAVNCIKENLEKTKLYENGRLLAGDVLSELEDLKKKNIEAFSIVFMDPPYGEAWEQKVLKSLAGTALINEETLFIIEADIDTSFPYLQDYGYKMIKEKKYKTNQHIFLHYIGNYL